ncbi:hypothetical protein L1987_49559 [Smallanthus sonchifolius]|uniref:Uncharacterized protein n=1 Tax=Smallanthus sonchifolius TaxID=185202 RepID=A0ACB9FUV3_9ASTR|nr:hypothetical protein L1987_49559 [Smallanthus sonchifolius]
MATSAAFLKTPITHPTNDTLSSSLSTKHNETTDSSSFSKFRFEAYNRLQSAAVAFGEKLPIPEIVALGGQSDGKSSLLEALLGFQFNVREVEMGTCRPLILQMVHDPTALDPRCRFQEEDSEEYGSPIVSSSAIADTIKSRTDALLKKTKTAVTSKPIVMRVEYAHCPNLTIIDTPGFVLKAKKGEPESTPEEILSMVISLASPPNRILLFLQQSSVEWCSSLWLDAIRDIDPTFRRTLIVVSKFDNRLKEFTEREVTAQLNIMDSKIQATSDVAHLRRSSMLFASSICNHVGALIDGAADPDPEQWGKTTEEEKSESGMGSWPGVISDIKPPNSTLRLYGGAAFERVMHEFRCAAYSVEYPTVSREKMSNITLAHAGRGGGRGIQEAAAEIARAAAKSWLAPLLDTACERLAFVLRNLFALSMEKNQHLYFDQGKKTGDMDGYVGFHAALRRSYNCFIQDLAKQRKQLVRQHLDSVTSPYSLVCYETDLLYGPGPNCTRSYRTSCLDFSDQENIPPANMNNKDQETTPGRLLKAEGEASMTVAETPAPDQPKEQGNFIEGGARKRHPRMLGDSRMLGSQNSSQQGSTYNEICSLAAQHFARIREVLVERSVATALNSGFLTPCREGLMVALGMDLFAVKDEEFMDMFVAPGAIDILQSERESLKKLQKTLHSCLTEFKSVATSL